MQFLLALGLALALHLGFNLAPFVPYLSSADYAELPEELQDAILNVDRLCLGQGYDASGVLDSVAQVTSVYLNGDGSGSAFYIGDGYWVTAAHVVEDARRIHIENWAVDIPNARVVGMLDYPVDLAVLSGPEQQVDALPIASDLRLGQSVLAIGYGQSVTDVATVTRGVYSAGYYSYLDGDLHMMHTDAAVNRGDSGGPLVNTCGEVVGVIQTSARDAQVEGSARGVSSLSLSGLLESMGVNIEE